MSIKYLVGIDEGTTSSRASIFDTKGNFIAGHGHEYGIQTPKPRWVEQDCDEITQALYLCCREAIKKSKIDPKDILGVGLSSQGAAFVPVDKDGKVVRPCFGWQDTRGSEMNEYWSSKISDEEYYKISGIPIRMTPFSISKIFWMREKEPQSYEKTAKFATHQDYFLRALGVDGHFSDIATGARTGFFDVDNHEYSQKLLDLFDIPKDKFAEIVRAGSMVGAVNDEVAAQTGIPKGTPLCVGGMDVCCSVLGLGVVESGMAATILGTYGACIGLSGKTIRDPNNSLFVIGNPGTRMWTIEGGAYAAASSYRWYRDLFAQTEVAEAAKSGKDPYELINEQIAASKPGSKGMLYIPHLASAGSPRNNPNARAMFIGMTFAHNKGDIARSVMEGITLEIRDIMETYKKAGMNLKEVRITGGGTKSPVWNQIQADIHGVPVKTVQTADTGALGAAMHAAVGVGVYKDTKEAAANMVTLAGEYEPNPANVAIYNEVYDMYTSVFESLEKGGAYDTIAAFQSKHG
jgi:xylulokinase